MPKFGEFFVYSRIKMEGDLIIFDGLDALHQRYAVFDMHHGILKIYDYEEKVVFCGDVQARPHK